MLDEREEALNVIKEHGEGIHHIAFKVTDLKEALEDFNKKGICIAQDRPRGNRMGGEEIVFLNKEDTCGILIELCQEKK
jgi:methylmalonyl-CoA/ethylmalonyl-CoA epimerase